MPSSHPPVVQISLDLTDISEALETARIAVEAGVDWLEAGTPFILAEGLHGVRALRVAFPNHPIVADLKTMDGGYLEAEMMAKAGATHVVVMARAHVETIKVVVKAGRDYDIKVMGDNLGCEDKAAASRMIGLTLEEAVAMPKRGAPLVVIGAPLAIDAHSFSVAAGDLKTLLREITRRVRE